MPVFIGDVHGKFTRYKDILKTHKNTIQVGDMGLGFPKSVSRLYDGVEKIRLTSPPFDHMKRSGARFIRGNHDFPDMCKRHKFYIPDMTVENNMMFVGGAKSIDRIYRTEGIDWWADEELSYEELNRMLDIYEIARPEIMVTHDCPDEIVPTVALLCNYEIKKQFPSITRQAFDAALSIHVPKLWVFGHWHGSCDIQYKGCRFVCLKELEVRELNI